MTPTSDERREVAERLRKTRDFNRSQSVASDVGRILLMRKGGHAMDEKKRARLVERDRNHFHRGQYEIWDVGDECGVYVDFNPCPYGMGNPETMAFPVDLRKYSVTSWQELGYWPYDATGGKAVRELGYEPIEEDGHDTD